ncbi:MAG: signal peptidase II [Lacunisphaera sp.]|nr:signal peptidase II [Lacunisphaera sp.]
MATPPPPDHSKPGHGSTAAAKPEAQSTLRSLRPATAGTDTGPTTAGNGAKSKIERLLAYRRLWLLAGMIIVLDQLTKHWINARLPLGSYGPGVSIEVFPGFFYLVHVGNTGAAWSMFTGMSLLLALLAGATLLAIFFWRRQLGLRQPAAQLAFGLLCGGIVGNLYDRIFRGEVFLRGHVLDFLDFHFGSYTYPTFNVADSAICVGVFWYVLWSLRQPPYQENPKSQTPDTK